MGGRGAQNFRVDTLHGGADGVDLGNDIDAIAVVGDHAGDAAHLALDTAEPL